MEEDSDTPNPREPSALAADIQDLKRTVRRLAEDRERIPQPLFWSLFHTRLEAMRKQKELSRVVAAALGEE